MANLGDTEEKMETDNHVIMMSPPVGGCSPSSRCSSPNVLFGHYLRVGNSDFLLRMNERGCYVDKSMFIEEVVQSTYMINVILRPPRFGKSLNLSMLKTFFEFNNSNRQIFKDLLIERTHPEYFEPNGPFGSLPVIYLDLKGEEGFHYVGVCDRLSHSVFLLYNQFSYLLQSDQLTAEQKEEYQHPRTNARLWLRILSKLLFLHHKSPCLILVDHYDDAFHSVTQPVHDELEGSQYLFELLSSFLIDNDTNIFRVVIMGVCYFSYWDDIRPKQSSIKVHTWKDAEFSDHFGFTNEEVTQLLTYYHANNACNPECVLSFYSGYKTRKGLCMSNPFSIASYLCERSIRPHFDFRIDRVVQSIQSHVLPLLSDRFSASPTKGIQSSCTSSLSLGARTTQGPNFWSGYGQGFRMALFFGFLGLSDEGNLVIPTVEAMNSWVVHNFDDDETCFRLLNPLFEYSFEGFDKGLGCCMKKFPPFLSHIRAKYFAHVAALCLFVVASLKGYQAYVYQNSAIELLGGVAMDTDSSCGFIVQFKSAKSKQLVDEAAVFALGIPENNHLERCPNMNYVYQVGIGVDSTTCSVVARCMEKGEIGEWSVLETYMSKTIQKYLFDESSDKQGQSEEAILNQEEES